jgi:release factor glutamine methyltransferase
LTPAATPSDVTALISRLRGAGCVFAEDEADLLMSAAQTPAELETMADRRVAGLPLEHVLGWVEFCGLRIAVDPGVFVPRRRTEFLVEQAALRTRPGAVVVDLCCGSGAVGVALGLALGGGTVQLHAADVDPVAIACASRNVARVGGTTYVGDLYDALPALLRGRIDVLVVNTPYVPTDAVAMMPPEARDFEPRVALDGGPDGLDIARRVAAEAPRWLAPDGWLLIETSEEQSSVLAEMFAAAGMLPTVTSGPDDLNATVVLGCLSAHANATRSSCQWW